MKLINLTTYIFNNLFILIADTCLSCYFKSNLKHKNMMLLPWICNISGKLVQMNEERLSRIEMLVASDLIPSRIMSFLAYC